MQRASLCVRGPARGVESSQGQCGEVAAKMVSGIRAKVRFRKYVPRTGVPAKKVSEILAEFRRKCRAKLRTVNWNPLVQECRGTC